MSNGETDRASEGEKETYAEKKSVPLAVGLGKGGEKGGEEKGEGWVGEGGDHDHLLETVDGDQKEEEMKMEMEVEEERKEEEKGEGEGGGGGGMVADMMFLCRRRFDHETSEISEVRVCFVSTHIRIYVCTCTCICTCINICVYSSFGRCMKGGARCMRKGGRCMRGGAQDSASLYTP